MIEIKEKYELPQIRSDKLFHDLINENEMDTIEWFVMQILECSYEEIHGKVEVKNIRLTRINKKERNKYVDLIVSFNNEKIIIELNNNFDGIYVRNFLFGMNQLMNNYQLGSGNYYKEITRVVLVNLNWYPNKKGDNIIPKRIQEISYSDEEADGYLFKMISVNLDYYGKFSYNQIDIKDKLYKLLTIKNKEELEILTRDEKLLKRYSNKLIKLSNDDDYMEDLMSEEMEEFIEQHVAYRNGLKQKEKEMIINMYKDNVELAHIAKYSNLTIQEVEKIIKEMKEFIKEDDVNKIIESK